MMKLVRHIASLLDWQTLRRTLLADEPEFNRYGAVQESGDRKRIYIDRGSRVLAVAHLDTVKSVRKAAECIPELGVVRSGRLDDRLGVYVLLHLLPKLGIKPDILLTTGEETGHSSAQWFDSDRRYGWIFSFDRRGDDVVTYQFDGAAWETALRKAGAKIGSGSFSDISYLEHLGVHGANWGVGYHGEHSDDCYAVLFELCQQVARFYKFWQAEKDHSWPWQEKPRLPYVAYKSANYSYGHGTSGKPLYGGYPIHHGDGKWKSRSSSDYYQDLWDSWDAVQAVGDGIVSGVYATANCEMPDRQSEHEEAWENGEPCWVCGRTQYDMLQEQRQQQDQIEEELQK